MPKPTVAETVAAQLAAVTEHNFEFLMKRFDRIEKQNDDQLKLMKDHTQSFSELTKVVERHSAYFGLAGLGLAPLVGWVAYKLGFKS